MYYLTDHVLVTNVNERNRRVNKCGRIAHVQRECRTGQRTSFKQADVSPHRNRTTSLVSGLTCYLCGKQGHIARNCRTLEKSPHHMASAAVHGTSRCPEQSRVDCEPSSECRCHAPYPVGFISSLGLCR